MGRGSAAGGGGGMAGTWGGGKGNGKAAKRMEQNSRTLKFTNFSEDTPASTIIQAIEERIKDTRSEIEEVFAFGRYADADGARFKTEEGLGAFLDGSGADLSFDHGGKKIYVGAARVGGDTPKERATRKVVRAIIEANGGNGRALKADGHVYANYGRGFVIWKGTRVAAWNESSETMEFSQEGAEFEQSFRKLLGSSG